jgi:hypothetical protein
MRLQTKPTLERYDCLYVWALDRYEFLPSEREFSGNWVLDSGWGFAFTASPSDLEVRFLIYGADGTKGLGQQRIPIVRTQCHYGGSRPWFRCPDCRRRVAMLVFSGTAFSCRHCADLGYRTQQVRGDERARLKAQKIQRRLGNPDWRNTLYPDLPRPKGMWRRTHSRLVEEAQEALGISQAGLLREVERLKKSLRPRS